MKLPLRKFLAALLALLLLAAALPVSAGDYVKGANGPSDSYREGPYYERLLSAPRTGDHRTDVLAVALSQLGYQESDENGEFSGTVGGTGNFTEYNYNMGDFGAGYGTDNYHWCASFVSFCLLQSGCHNLTKISDWCRKHPGDPNYIWREVSCSQWVTQLTTCGYYEKSVSKGGSYRPVSGDLIFFAQNPSGNSSHIGLVLYADASTVYTVEGNTSDGAGLDVNGGGVYYKSYPLDSTYVIGYGTLPYKANNDTQLIDYSGARPTAGQYVATTNKYVYKTATATSYSYLLPRFSTFTVTEIASNGRLKVTCEIGGETVTGYVENNTDRVIQYSATVAPTAYPPLAETRGYLASVVDSTLLNGLDAGFSPEERVLSLTDTVGIRGWIGCSQGVNAIGYYFDGARNDVTWATSALRTPENAVLTAGGKRATRYELSARVGTAGAGEHTVTFLARMKDGTVAAIGSYTYHAKAVGTVPQAPSVASKTSSSVTLRAVDGCEYRVNGGDWQKSPIFTDLEAGKVHVFEQRTAETFTAFASLPSPKCSVTLKAPETTATTEAPPVTTEPTVTVPVTTVAVTGPATSEVEPTTSEVDPTTSEVDPTTSEVDPTTSEVDPTTSEVDPNTSEVDPTTSEIEPTTSEVESAPDTGTVADPPVGGCAMTLAPTFLLPALLALAVFPLRKREE